MPALQALERLKDTGEVGVFELTDEAPAPPEIGGYLIGWRSVSQEGGRQVQMEGVYHLVSWGGEWKIEDLYLTTFDRQELPQWVSLARDYQQLVQAARESRNAAPRAGAPTPSGDNAQTPTATSWQKSINRSQQWRGIGLLVLLGGAALVPWLGEQYRAKYAQP